jgi:capsular exopolysaccharide synthesis family protein
MEPIDYLKVVKHHWKVIVALVVLAMAATFFTSPKDPSTAFAAEHKLLREQAATGEGGEDLSTSNANPGVVAAFAEAGEVPARVAEAVGWSGDPGEVVNNVEVEVDPELFIITLRATAGTRADAIELVNAFGEQLVLFVDEREQVRVDGRVTEATQREQRLRDEIGQLESELAANPNNRVLQGQLDAKAGELGRMLDGIDAEGNRTRYVSMVRATTAAEQAGFISGIGRGQRTLLMGLVAALAGFGVAIMLDRSDSRLRSKEQVERRFGLPVLAEVPLLALRDRSRAAVVAFEREPRVAEAYRGLRTALLLFRGRVENDRHSTTSNGNGNAHTSNVDLGSLQPPAGAIRQLVVVTSPEAGDGKSTSTANLAMAYAETGQSVLIVSWDLWRPLSPGVFDAQEGPGVAEYLEGHGSALVRYVQDTSIPGVRIVTAGLGGHHPYTQIENARRLLEEARTLANVVIVDTAPILSSSVTRELVTLGDAVVVVCRAGRTTGPAADRCAELLERLGAPTLGVVLVGVPTGPFADYYGAPPKDSRPGFRRRVEPGTGRHLAPTSSPLRPTSAQYRAATPRSPEDREPR